MKRVVALVACAACALPSLARAQSKGDEMPDFMKKPVVATRRHGFTMGIVAAPALYWTHGTPSNYVKRNAEFEVKIGPAVTPDVQAFIGYALADELSFTLSLSPFFTRHDDVKISGSTFAFRIEVFPLVSFGGALRDLGVAGRFGFGSARFTQISTGDSLASSAFSLVGLEVFWDGARLGGFGFGPSIGAAYRFGDTYADTTITAGIRAAFYGGP